jgi:tetratricopeptide (TPR) repeat protein
MAFPRDVMAIVRRAFVLWIITLLPALAHEAIRRGYYDMAINALDTYHAFNPNNAATHLMLGWAYFKKGDQTRARDAYSEAIRLDPRRADAYVGRGSAHGAARQLDEAIADLNEALRLDPNSADACYNRGLAYAHQGEFAKAIVDFDRTLQLAPAHVAALQQRANLYSETKKYAQAIDDYEALLCLDSENANVRLALVDLLSTCPDTSVRNVRRADEEADRLDPHAIASQRTFARLAAAHAGRSELDQAITWQRKALACVQPFDKERKRRAALVLELYRKRKKRADKASLRRATRTASPPQGGGQ